MHVTCGVAGILFPLLAGLWLCFPVVPAQGRDAASRPPVSLSDAPRNFRSTVPQAFPAAPVTMPQAVQMAIRRNPSLGAGEAQSRASEEGRKAARGAFGPRLGMSYTAIKQERKTAPVSARPPELGTYSLGIEISQPVFRGFRLLASYQKAALQAESDKASLRNAELAMTEQVQTAFLRYLSAVENVASEKEALARLKEQLEITTAYYEVGLRPRLDILQAEVDVSEAESGLIRMETIRDTSLAQLNTLLGFSPATQGVYSGKLAHVPFDRSLEQCLEAAYRQRPDLYVAAKAVEIAGKDRRIAQSGYYPQIEAYYNITNTGNTPDLKKSGDGGSRGTTWEVGGRVTWEIFQWGTTYYADKQAGWLVTKMRQEEDRLKLDAGYDIKSKLLALREAEKRIKVAERGVSMAREAYEAALASYREQVGTNFDVLDASSKLVAAQAALTGAKADYLTALSQMYVSMGEYHPDLFHVDAGAGRRARKAR